MAHAINELAEGIHSFATAREHAWHRLGTVVEDSFDARTALDAAHLAGWNVRKAPVFMLDENGNTLDVDRKFATFYTNPITGENQALGVVGSYYEPIQNEQHVELLDAIVDQSGAHFETAGSLYGGRQVFISMKMPNTIHVGGKDPVDLYLVAMNSHDEIASVPVHGDADSCCVRKYTRGGFSCGSVHVLRSAHTRRNWRDRGRPRHA
jgi:hypothetical protein